MKTWIIAALLIILPGVLPSEARKKGYSLKTETRSRPESEEQKMEKGSFMVASQCTDCNNGYMISQISFSGYDKPQSSPTETFFITNGTDRTMSGITMYVEYLTLDGRQLHNRFVRLVCNIPPGETRMADIKSWDKQKSFYFEKSAASKRQGMPYTVVFDPISFYLKY